MQLKQKLTIFSMMIGIFLCMLDTTVMNIALPAIQRGLNVNLGTLSWALNSYTIIFAVFTIPFGRLADMIGRNKVYLTGLLLFFLGSLLSGSAGQAVGLIIGRVIQSLGAAIIFPASMTIGISSTDIAHRTGVLAALGVTQGVASAFGPTIGGIVTQYWGWRYVFLINLPLTLVALILCWRLLPLKGEKRFNAKIDVLGMLSSMVMLFSLTLALVKGNDWGWSSLVTISLLTISAISLLGFIIVERLTSDPMVPLDLFKNRQFTGASLTTIVTEIFLVAILVIMPTFFTNLLNKSELTAALMITPASVMIFIFSPIGGFLNAKLGPRLLVSSGFLQIMIGYLILSSTNLNHYLPVVISFLLIGGGFGIIAGPLVVLGAANFTGKLLSASQSVLGVFRQIGTLLAVAIFVSGLTTNLTTARHRSMMQTNTQIETAQLPRQTKMALRSTSRVAIMNHDQSANDHQQGLTPAKTHHLIHTTYRQTLTSIPNATHLSPTKKALIYTKVARTVKQKVANQNRQLKPMINQIESTTRKNMTNAFQKGYQMAFPFTLLAIGISLLFEKKRRYTR